MLQQRLLVLMLLLLSRIVSLVEASTRPNHLNSISDGGTTSALGPAAAVYDKQPKQQAWQPNAARSNWIILQAATASGATNHRYDTAVSQSATQTRSYDARNDFQLQRLPINYYAYNRSAGNYQRPPPAPTAASSSAHVAQPYVLAISKVRRRPVPLVSAGADTQPQDSTSTFVRHNDRHNNGNNKSDASHARNSGDDGDNAPQTRRQDIDSRNRNSLNDGNRIDIGDGDEGASSYEAEAELNDILLPLENALDRVRHLCDVVKRIVTNVDEDTDDPSYSASSMSNTAAVAALAARNDVPASVSAEVQGRTLQPPHSATTSVGTGRGKKLKKKLKKLLLPLLIAYKLKFLTLIPVLIGGLTLLVGTTGLAGFFFALFTAVMSLKSGGGKSIVVKKI